MHSESHYPYDALLIVSFGGPERPEEVMPFLENVTRGRGVPRERLLDVAEHYYHFGGKSPINDQCREMMRALEKELGEHGPKLPIYWGNRNWKPFLSDTLRQMRDDGVKRALAFMTSAYSSYSGCRQYREDVIAAQAKVGEGAPAVEKLRVFYNHPHFIEPAADRIREALGKIPKGRPAYVVFTAHSIPVSMAENSDYEKQLRETCRLVAEATGVEQWELVYQSRSGAPGRPWLEPDILEYLRHLHKLAVRNVVVAPIGFISDHIEVLFDLDIEAKNLAMDLGMTLVRAGTVGTHTRFIQMIRELIVERMNPDEPRLAIGAFGAHHDVCPADCCTAPQRASISPAGSRCRPVIILK
jgi:protoporphyrin/coproporphyrin ferrochelatase